MSSQEYLVTINVPPLLGENRRLLSLFNQADIFMYQAKQAGRNQVYGIY
jgi:PleD family two-component response regulator